MSNAKNYAHVALQCYSTELKNVATTMWTGGEMIHNTNRFTVRRSNIIKKVKNSLGNIQFETFWYVRPLCLDLRTQITPHMLCMELGCGFSVSSSLFVLHLFVDMNLSSERERERESTFWLLNKLHANWTIGARCKRDAGWFDCPSTRFEKDLNHRWNSHLNGDELPPFFQHSCRPHTHKISPCVHGGQKWRLEHARAARWGATGPSYLKALLTNWSFSPSCSFHSFATRSASAPEGQNRVTHICHR